MADKCVKCELVRVRTFNAVEGLFCLLDAAKPMPVHRDYVCLAFTPSVYADVIEFSAGTWSCVTEKMRG